jgi:hypothetical protein
MLKRLIDAFIILVAISLLLFGFFHEIPEAMGLTLLIMAGW